MVGGRDGVVPSSQLGFMRFFIIFLFFLILFFYWARFPGILFFDFFDFFDLILPMLISSLGSNTHSPIGTRPISDL